jgi:hypothetical protein
MRRGGNWRVRLQLGHDLRQISATKLGIGMSGYEASSVSLHRIALAVNASLKTLIELDAIEDDQGVGKADVLRVEVSVAVADAMLLLSLAE